jgi:hypothetical protein
MEMTLKLHVAYNKGGREGVCTKHFILIKSISKMLITEVLSELSRFAVLPLISDHFSINVFHRNYISLRIYTDVDVTFDLKCGFS